MPTFPYIIGGKVFQSDGSTPSSGTTVTITQRDTGDKQTTITNSSGNYVFDLANFTTAYSDGQYYKITAKGSTSVEQDLRMRLTARDILQISEITIEYTTS